MQWFRFYHEALDDPKVQRLPGELYKAWVNILCLASQQTERGTLPAVDDIAFRLRLDHQKTEDALLGLKRAGLVEVDPQTDNYVIHAWAERQPLSDADSTATERKRRQRAKTNPQPSQQKAVTRDVTRDGSVTSRIGHGPVTGDVTRLEKNRVEKSREEERRVDVGGAAAPQQPATPVRPVRSVPKPKDEPAPQNPWWDALVAGIGFTPATDQERQLYGKAVRELRALEASPDDILARCANYRASWPDADLTVPALLKHWSRMEHPPPIRPPSGQRRSTADEQNRELLEQIRRQEQGHEPDPFPGAIDADWRGHEQSTQPRTLRPVVAEVRRPAR